MVRVRALGAGDLRSSSELHADVLDMEFLARFGLRFLRRYHRAWIDSPAALSLVAVDDEGRVVGVLLGSLRPAEHYRYMVRRHGAGLATSMALGAAARPRLAAELVRTRGKRYARALARQFVARFERGRPAGAAVRESAVTVGEITHVMVGAEQRRGGVGRALMMEGARAAEAAGVAELVLVTPPDLPAVTFYGRLGWEQTGNLTSASGEEFVRFRLRLENPADPAS